MQHAETVQREKVHLTEEKATLLITLYAKALDNRQRHPILADRVADDAVRRIDADFRAAKASLGDRVALALRAKVLDRWVAAFLAAHPGAIVLHLGCGLDSRVYRVDPPVSVRWYDLDYPDVIALRERLYPARAGYHTIASSVTDWEWLNAVSADGPVCVIAEGLLPYLAESEVRELLRRLTNRFSDGEIAFDALNPLAKRLGGSKGVVVATGASFQWTMDDPHDIERWNPRLTLMETVPLVAALDTAGVPWSIRLLCRGMARIPAMRDFMRLVRFRF